MSVKGMVLAAGLGTRLRPLTDLYAKPLIPFLGTTPLELALWRLKAAGIGTIAVNSHYHAEQIAAVVGARPLGLDLHLSHEPAILGTGGCYNPIKSWLGEDDLLVINGDVVSSVDVKGLLKAHRDSAAIATMALLPSVIPGESSVFYEGKGPSLRIVGFGRTKPSEAVSAGNFACVQVFKRAFLDLMPTSGVFDVISKGYQAALSQGHKVAAFVHEGVWHDIRNPAFYWLAVKDLLENEGDVDRVGVAACRAARGLKSQRKGNVLSDASSKIGRGVVLQGTVMVEPGAEVGDDSSLSDCLLLPGAKVPARAVEKNAIIGENLRIAL